MLRDDVPTEALYIVRAEARRNGWRASATYIDVDDLVGHALLDMLYYAPRALRQPALLRVCARQAFQRAILRARSPTNAQQRALAEWMDALLHESQHARLRVLDTLDTLRALRDASSGLERAIASLLLNPEPYFTWCVVLARSRHAPGMQRASPFAVRTVARYLRTTRYKVRKAATRLRARLAAIERR